MTQEYYKTNFPKLLDFSELDFEAWKTDEDRVRTPMEFWFRRSDWTPRPVTLVLQHNASQATNVDMTPAEVVDLYEKLGEFIEEHRLREHS